MSIQIDFPNTSQDSLFGELEECETFILRDSRSDLFFKLPNSDVDTSGKFNVFMLNTYGGSLQLLSDACPVTRVNILMKVTVPE